MRFGKILGRDALQFRNIAANERSLGIVIDDLFEGGIHPDRIDAGRPGLHLKLAEVNSRLEIQKVARQENRRRSPMQPQVM